MKPCASLSSFRRRVAPSVLAALAALLLPACTPLYAPNAVDAPLFGEAGEVQAAGYLGSNGMEGQAAAALPGHIGVMAHVQAYRFGDRKRAIRNDRDFRRHTFAEGALGYYGSALLPEPLRYGIYAGYGRGQAEAIDFSSFLSLTPDAFVDEGRFERLFVQGHLGVRAPFAPLDLFGGSGGIDVAGTLRATRVRFYEFERDATTAPGSQTRMFVEPATTVRVGTRHVQFETQGGLSWPVHSTEESRFGFIPLFFSFGVRARFNALRFGKRLF